MQRKYSIDYLKFLNGTKCVFCNDVVTKICGIHERKRERIKNNIQGVKFKQILNDFEITSLRVYRGRTY